MLSEAEIVFEVKRKDKKKGRKKNRTNFFQKEHTRTTKIMNAAGRIVLLVLAILVAVALLTLTIVLSVLPKTVTNDPVQPVQNTNFAIPSGFNQAYTNSASGAFEVIENKPFVVNSRRQGLNKNSFVFSNMPFTQVVAQTSVGFTFYVYQEQVVTGLQCVDQYFASGSRQIAIFEVGRRVQLVNAQVSKVSDALVQGLRTHSLLYQEQVHLYPGILYACMGQVEPGDYRSLENASTGLFTNDVSFIGTCSIASPILTLPNSFPSSAFATSPFPGFQLQTSTPLNFVPTFRVDEQSASMPLNYIADFNLEITHDRLRVFPGACASQNGVYNIQTFHNIDAAFAGMTFDPNTWYAIYVTNKQDTLLISSNYPEPKLTQSELESIVFRRIGFAQTTSDPTKFVPGIQSGPETRRTMTFTNPEARSQVVELKDGGAFVLALDMVAPTTTICTLQVELLFDNSVAATPSVLLTFGSQQQVISFRENQSYQIVQIVLLLSESLIPRATSFNCAFGQPFATSVPKATFTVLNYIEDI